MTRDKGSAISSGNDVRYVFSMDFFSEELHEKMDEAGKAIYADFLVADKEIGLSDDTNHLVLAIQRMLSVVTQAAAMGPRAEGFLESNIIDTLRQMS